MKYRSWEQQTVITPSDAEPGQGDIYKGSSDAEDE